LNNIGLIKVEITVRHVFSGKKAHNTGKTNGQKRIQILRSAFVITSLETQGKY